MIYWYQNLYMDETVEKNPKRCKKRVEKRRPWKKSYVVLTLAQNDKNLFEIMQTRQLFFSPLPSCGYVCSGTDFGL